MVSFSSMRESKVSVRKFRNKVIQVGENVMESSSTAPHSKSIGDRQVIEIKDIWKEFLY